MANRKDVPHRGDLRPQPSRRSFLQGAVTAGAALALPAAGLGLFGGARRVSADSLTQGDIAILQFLAAAELVETDLWQQYCELAVSNRLYRRALEEIDPSLIRYICDDRDDEHSHGLLINGYLASIDPGLVVNLDGFRTLDPVEAPGAENAKRLTNLRKLKVDTSWFNRYRGAGNPDFGDSFPQFVTLNDLPTVPTSGSVRPADMRVIAQTAAFHFAAIEQGGSSLYATLIQQVTHGDVVRILASIGPTEVYHFAAFHKALEGLPGVKARDGLTIPNLRRQPELAQAIFPEPCKFLQANMPLCSVIRPSSTANSGARAAALGLAGSGLFEGQSQQFFTAVLALADAADAAIRGV